MANKKADFLIDHARANPNWEAPKAEAMFRKFMSGGFSYDELTNHPDYLVYASAWVLAGILPLIIDEMFARADTLNFLVYPVITAVDPLGNGHVTAAERTEELVELVDKNATMKILKLLTSVKADPPIPVERLDRIIAFWEGMEFR